MSRSNFHRPIRYSALRQVLYWIGFWLFVRDGLWLFLARLHQRETWELFTSQVGGHILYAALGGLVCLGISRRDLNRVSHYVLITALWSLGWTFHYIAWTSAYCDDTANTAQCWGHGSSVTLVLTVPFILLGYAFASFMGNFLYRGLFDLHQESRH